MAEFRHLSSVDQNNKSTLITIASGPVIIEDGKVLVDKQRDDFWKFPGGRVDSNQSFEAVAKLRVKEELNLEVELVGEPYVVNFTRVKDGQQEMVILIHYLGKIISGQPQPQGEVTEFAWLNIDNLPADCAPNVRLAVAYFKSRNL